MHNVIFQNLKLPHCGKFFVGGIKARVSVECEILTHKAFKILNTLKILQEIFKSFVSLIYISLNVRTLKMEKAGGSIDCSKRLLK